MRYLSARVHYSASTDPRACHARSGLHGAPGHTPNRWLEHAGKLPRNNNGENIKHTLLHLAWSEALCGNPDGDMYRQIVVLHARARRVRLCRYVSPGECAKAKSNRGASESTSLACSQNLHRS